MHEKMYHEMCNSLRHSGATVSQKSLVEHRYIFCSDSSSQRYQICMSMSCHSPYSVYQRSQKEGVTRSLVRVFSFRGRGGGMAILWTKEQRRSAKLKLCAATNQKCGLGVRWMNCLMKVILGEQLWHSNLDVCEGHRSKIWQ